MMSGEVEKKTPAYWAASEAQLAFYQSGEIDEQLEDRRILWRLDQDAEDLFFADQTYFVRAKRGLALPASFEADEAVEYDDLYDFAFEGPFRCYSKVEVGQIIGRGAVRAYCMVFDEAFLLPRLETISSDKLLHVPILAVEEMKKAA